MKNYDLGKSNSVVRGVEISEWKRAGKRHRIDGPALTSSSGLMEWWQRGKLHRRNGPAVVMPSGTRAWFVRGRRHRIDGPAIERSNGENEWWLYGRQFTEQQFQTKIVVRLSALLKHALRRFFN